MNYPDPGNPTHIQSQALKLARCDVIPFPMNIKESKG